MKPYPLQANRQKCFRGFSLIELLVVISIIAILSSMVIVVVGVVRFQARSTACASQLHQWGLALVADATDHEGMLCSDQIQGSSGQNTSDVSVQSFDRMVNDYGMSTRIQDCPHNFTKISVSDYDAAAQAYRGAGFVFLGYGYWVQRSDLSSVFPPNNVACPTLLSAPNPGNVPMMVDYIGRDTSGGPFYGGHQRQIDGSRSVNQLFTDGHTGAVNNPSDIVWRYNGNWENWR